MHDYFIPNVCSTLYHLNFIASLNYFFFTIQSFNIYEIKIKNVRQDKQSAIL